MNFEALPSIFSAIIQSLQGIAGKNSFSLSPAFALAGGSWFGSFPAERGSDPEGDAPRDRCNMGKGASVPKPNKRQERLQERLLRAQLKQAEAEFEMPEIPAPLPLEEAPPPPTQTSADALYAEEEERRKALKRTNARRNTVYAGETGKLAKTAKLG